MGVRLWHRLNLAVEPADECCGVGASSEAIWQPPGGVVGFDHNPVLSQPAVGSAISEGGGEADPPVLEAYVGDLHAEVARRGGHDGRRVSVERIDRDLRIPPDGPP